MKRVEFERLLAFAKSQAVAAGGVEALPEVLATVVTVVGPSKLLIAEAVFFASSKSLSTNVIRTGWSKLNAYVEAYRDAFLPV